MKRKVFLMAALFNVLIVSAQQKDLKEIIASSQTGASVVFFKATKDDIGKIVLGNYNNLAETNARKGLPFFFDKAKKGKSVIVAYIGGSITRANNMYRNQSLGFIQKIFPKTEVTGINAGISGSDTDLGASRIYDQVLKYNPDLIFIEFAVNGGFPEGMEGIVRQIIKHNASTDICIIYTVMSEQLKYYKNGTMPSGIQRLEEIAVHYNIPSIHMGMEVAELVKQGKMIAKGNPSVIQGMTVFSKDGVHPLETGGDLYASAIARSMLRMQRLDVLAPYKLPCALLKDNWEDAKMIAPDSATYSDGWMKIDPKITAGLKAYKEWFPYIMTAENTSETFRFRYNGKAFGLFDVGGPEVGQLDVYVDGKQVDLKAVKNDEIYKIEKDDVKAFNRFNKFCNNRHRGQYFFVETTDGTHEVVFEISAEMADKKAILGPLQEKDINKNPQKYKRSVIYIGKILIRGELLHELN